MCRGTILRTIVTASAIAFPALSDPLPSWDDTAARSAIIAFLEGVTDPAGESYVTLGSDKPVHYQALCARDILRARRSAPRDPDAGCPEGGSRG